MAANLQEKLRKLAEIEGYDDPMEFITQECDDSVVMGICTNPHCDNTVGVEPDQRAGFCECCETNTVQSALVLAGMI